MSPNLDALTAQVLALPLEDRRELVLRVWSSVEDQEAIDPELLAEIERRDAEMEAGNIVSLPFDQAMREIRDFLK
jgi:putative addiction module component (TIGR02574 family)